MLFEMESRAEGLEQKLHLFSWYRISILFDLYSMREEQGSIVESFDLK